MEYTLVPMNQSHLPALSALEKICFSDPWSENAFRTELMNPRSRFVVAQNGQGLVLGYLGLHYVLDEGYIANIAVDPLFRRQGIAGTLLQDVRSFAREQALSFLTLEVRKSNQAAQHLYEKHGFSPVGVRKNYYEHPTEDALLMTLILTGKGDNLV